MASREHVSQPEHLEHILTSDLKVSTMPHHFDCALGSDPYGSILKADVELQKLKSAFTSRHLELDLPHVSRVYEKLCSCSQQHLESLVQLIVALHYQPGDNMLCINLIAYQKLVAAISSNIKMIEVLLHDAQNLLNDLDVRDRLNKEKSILDEKISQHETTITYFSDVNIIRGNEHHYTRRRADLMIDQAELEVQRASINVELSNLHPSTLPGQEGERY